MKNRKPNPKPKTDDAPMPNKPGYGVTFVISPIDNEYLVKGRKYPIINSSKYGFWISTNDETIFCLFDQCFHIHPHEWQFCND